MLYNETKFEKYYKSTLDRLTNIDMKTLKDLLTAEILSNISSRTNSCKNIPSTVVRARLADLALMLKSWSVVIGLG